MSRRGWAVAVCIALVVGACGSVGPRTSGPPAAPLVWRELTSEHFVVWTNTPAARAQKLVKSMETLRQIVLGISFVSAPVRGKILVVAFDTLAEARGYLTAPFIAHAWSAPPLLAQPVIVLAAESLENDARIVAHELTHVVAFNVIPSQPKWFAEGMAGYYETIRLDEKHASLDVGVPREGNVWFLQKKGHTPVAEMMACREPACMDERFYATTWAFFAYLVMEQPEVLQRYVVRLREAPPEGHDPLWASVAPGLTPAVLDREIDTWVRHGSNRVLKFNIQLREWTFTERSLSETDVLVAKGLVRHLLAYDAPPSPEIEQALAAEPLHLLANVVRASARRGISFDEAHALTQAHPGDWRAWLMSWQAATTNEARREGRERTCALAMADASVGPLTACTHAEMQDARRAVFDAAMQQANHCWRATKPHQLPDEMVIELDIADSGAVTSAHAMLGSDETNRCAEEVLRRQVFPPHHPGPFSMRTAVKKPTK